MPVFSRILSTIGAALALATTLAPAAPAAAQGLFDQPKYASIVVDANTGEVLYALRADQRRYPASITKVMTLYLTFEALATGRLSLNDRVPFSAHAAAQAPTKLGVRPGDDISVNEAIQAAAVMSANDVAVALAEKVGGSEDHFAKLMTLRAQELGMANSHFVNANGLPDTRQITTARDIAILSRAVMRDYPQYYAYFNQHAFSWHGRTVLNHNRLLLRMPGMDGLKTGYTNAAGFNLAASAVRDGRRLITVVLGGSSTAARDENVENLLQAGFDVLGRRARGQTITLASALNEPDDSTGPLMRAPVEMGSADQPGLRVVMGQPVPNPVERAPEMRVARADIVQPRVVAAALRMAPATERECRTVTVRRHHRRVSERECRTVKIAPENATTLADCRKLHGRKAKACKTEAIQMAKAARKPSVADCHGLRGRKAKACKAEAVQMAKAETTPSLADCHGLRGRRLKSCRTEAKAAPVALALRDCNSKHGKHRKACATEPATETAQADGGGYMIQVGAFTSRGDARAHLAKLSHSHGALFGGASEKVEGAGKTYRARFAGLSAKDAKTACKRLSAKGERCMVLSPG